MKTLDQIRAGYAWKRVQNPTKEYQNLAKSLPAMIMTNGLMQTLAFLKGKSKPGTEHDRLCKDILAWLKEAPAIRKEDYEEAVTEIVEQMDSIAYQRATEEALAVLRWIRYLAQTVGASPVSEGPGKRP